METTPLNTLLYLYHTAMRSFEKGMYEQAGMEFTETFSLVSRILREKKNAALHRPDEMCFDDFDLYPFVQVTLSSPPYSSCYFGSLESQETLMIFPHPLNLPELFTIEQFAFITLYNLALSTYVSALVNNRSTRQLQKATELWELIYSLQWREELNLQPVHTLAILTNLGHARRVLGNEASSKVCYQNILTTLEFMRGRNEDVHYKSFFMYAAHRMLSTEAAAAA
jgi:hypothetical protein